MQTWNVTVYIIFPFHFSLVKNMTIFKPGIQYIRILQCNTSCTNQIGLFTGNASEAISDLLSQPGVLVGLVAWWPGRECRL